MADQQTAIANIESYLKANPTAKGMLYDLTIRGAYGAAGTFGTIQGAHAEIKYQVPNPATGAMEDRTTGQLPLSALPSDPVTWATLTSVLPVALAVQQQTIDAQAATLAANSKQIAELTAAAEAATKQIASLTATVQTHVANAAKVAGLVSQIAAVK